MDVRCVTTPPPVGQYSPLVMDYRVPSLYRIRSDATRLDEGEEKPGVKECWLLAAQLILGLAQNATNLQLLGLS